ncbi:endonuclease domain-containing protein [Luteimonas mephitis]|uniref:endonuclease domain-containing protein n=1 Tax=Luteimonas mephitis TaxID=83615 RepID=UPI00042901E6|nr:DUF559 domain-containing protein [Luteimonas mephitis]
MRNGHRTGFARHLRRTMTDAERAIWHHLRNRAFMGCKFRRQYPIGPYIVDFACPACRLVVELDRGQHHAARDAVRTRRLEIAGYRILRFWNNDVFVQQDTVLSVIFDALEGPPSPQPLSRRRERG